MKDPRDKINPGVEKGEREYLKHASHVSESRTSSILHNWMDGNILCFTENITCFSVSWSSFGKKSYVQA